MTASRPWKPTKVQQDVLDRMKAGWLLVDQWHVGNWALVHGREPTRHVADITAQSLIGRGMIRWDEGTETWVLV